MFLFFSCCNNFFYGDLKYCCSINGFGINFFSCIAIVALDSLANEIIEIDDFTFAKIL
ncbi:hypothetical protein D3C72_2276480 [compost metagenome]